MKKKICICLILIILIFSLNMKVSYGRYVLNIGIQLGPAIERTEWGGGQGNTEEEAKMLEQLKFFGYEGQIQNKIRWETTVKIGIDRNSYNNIQNRANGKYWYVKFNDGVVETDIKFEDVKTTYSCQHHKPSDEEIKKMVDKTIGTDQNEIEVFSYKAVVIAEKDLSNLPTKNSETGEPIPGLRYFLTSIYTDADMKLGNEVQIDETNTEIQSITR